MKNFPFSCVINYFGFSLEASVFFNCFWGFSSPLYLLHSYFSVIFCICILITLKKVIWAFFLFSMAGWKKWLFCAHFGKCICFFWNWVGRNFLYPVKLCDYFLSFFGSALWLYMVLRVSWSPYLSFYFLIVNKTIYIFDMVYDYTFMVKLFLQTVYWCKNKLWFWRVFGFCCILSEQCTSQRFEFWAVLDFSWSFFANGVLIFGFFLFREANFLKEK